MTEELPPASWAADLDVIDPAVQAGDDAVRGLGARLPAGTAEWLVGAVGESYRAALMLGAPAPGLADAVARVALRATQAVSAIVQRDQAELPDLDTITLLDVPRWFGFVDRLSPWTRAKFIAEWRAGRVRPLVWAALAGPITKKEAPRG